MKITFTDIEIKTIIELYTKDGLNTTKIGVKLGISKTPISRVLKDNGLLKKGSSNGVKISLTNEQERIIKKLYLKEYKSCEEIAQEVGLTKSFVDKFLSKCDFRRDKGKAASIGLVKRYRDMNYDEYLEQIDIYYKYELEVLKITRQQPIKLLDNYNNRGNSGVDGAYHLDHKYSIIEGFKNNIKPELIGNIKNLEFIPWKENLKKRAKCSITLEELIKE
jgi:predicted transcriptional regulator